MERERHEDYLLVLGSLGGGGGGGAVGEVGARLCGACGRGTIISDTHGCRDTRTAHVSSFYSFRAYAKVIVS